MSYLVLARKYRPQTFDELIGQEHIVSIIKSALTSNRIAHAYLFCGPRGIGKTSCARILAKSLNCEKGPTLTPCGKCSACKEIAGGSNFDVLEIDGASNRGIDEIRSLRENVKFAPGYGNYKIYIVDEVHMLTMEAFNALLKTLEEPPSHVKFIFATTAPHKVPATIISRCQRYDFKRITIPRISEVLKDIARKEKVKIDADAMFAIGKAAKGSLRDALSILDQLSSISKKSIESQDVFQMLGLVETQLLFDMTDALTGKNCTLALELLERIIGQGKDTKQLVKDLVEHFRNLMIIKIGGPTLSKLVDYPPAFKDVLLKQSEFFTLKDILNSVNCLVEAQETSRVTESLRMPLEIAIAKIAYAKEGKVPEVAELPARPEKKTVERPNPAVELLKSKKGQVNVSKEEAEEEVKEEAKEAPEEDKEKPATPEAVPEENIAPEAPEEIGEPEALGYDSIKKRWDALTHAVSRKKMSIATFLSEGMLVDAEGDNIIVGFTKDHQFHKETLEDKGNIKFVEDVISESLNRSVRIKYKWIDAYKPHHEENPKVKNILNTFDGKVISQWHNE